MKPLGGLLNGEQVAINGQQQVDVVEPLQRVRWASGRPAIDAEEEQPATEHLELVSVIIDDHQA